jgi:DNA-directed RNA polymerase alpha subunit
MTVLRMGFQTVMSLSIVAPGAGPVEAATVERTQSICPTCGAATDRPIVRVSDLGLSARSRAALERYGVRASSNAESVAKLTASELVAVPGCGKSCLDEIRDALKAYGLFLRG